MSDQRQFQTYQHYKGGIYFKLAEALHTETDENLTVYMCATSGRVYCRPTAMFNEILMDGDYQGPRFIPLPDETTKQQRQSLKFYGHAQP